MAGNKASMLDTNHHATPTAIIKDCMSRKKLSYNHLSIRLAKRGIHIEQNALRNKINRHAYRADFFIEILSAMDEYDASWVSHEDRWKKELGKTYRQNSSASVEQAVNYTPNSAPTNPWQPR